MQKIIIYTVILVASLVGKVVAQNLNSIEKTTEWIAPILAQASIAIAASTTIGM